MGEKSVFSEARLSHRHIPVTPVSPAGTTTVGAACPLQDTLRQPDNTVMEDTHTEEGLSHSHGTEALEVSEDSAQGNESPTDAQQTQDQGEHVTLEEEVADDTIIARDCRTRTLKTPAAPTKQQREEHEATHAVFQPWCRACVRGRGRNIPHRTLHPEQRLKPGLKRVSLDYFFFHD